VACVRWVLGEMPKGLGQDANATSRCRCVVTAHGKAVAGVVARRSGTGCMRGCTGKGGSTVRACGCAHGAARWRCGQRRRGGRRVGLGRLWPVGRVPWREKGKGERAGPCTHGKKRERQVGRRFVGPSS
jgi:hypothetical protein